jgi:hypothetical protein
MDILKRCLHGVTVLAFSAGSVVSGAAQENLFQAAPTLQSPFTEKERALYSQKRNFGDRMDFFDDVVARYRKEFEAYNKRKDFDGFMKFLESYSRLMKIIGDDVNEIPGEKKGKSKGLRKLEIQLRRAKEDLQNFKSNAALDQQTAFDNAISQSESLRTKILQIIFGKEFLKDK